MKSLRPAFFVFAFVFSLHAAAGPPPAPLRWGADMESGAPFSFSDPKNPKKLIGYEVDIVAAIGRELGRPAQFVQNNWEGLIEGLKRGDYDMVINGLEITPDRAEVVLFTDPYYITAELLAVNRNTYTINSLADTTGKKVGTLEGSLAHRILLEQKNNIEVLPYNEEILAYNDLANGRIDAVLLDEPIHIYYAQPNPKIKRVGPPIGYMEYGIAFRQSDKVLREQVNNAIRKMINDGTLRAILEKWGMWNVMTAKAWGLDASPKTQPDMYNYYMEATGQVRGWKEQLVQYVGFLPLLGKGALITLEISLMAMVVAILSGLVIALMRLYGPSFISWLALAYVEIFRGTPLLIQLYLIFYGLPRIGIRLDPLTAAVIGLGLNYGACEAENYRAGILSVPKSQMDASQALGMSRWQSLRHVIIPQAMRLVIPPVTNDFIALLKDSSLVSVITMIELTTIYGQLASTYFDYLGIGILTALVYFVIGLPFVRLSRYFEAQLVQNSDVKKYSSKSRLFTLRPRRAGVLNT